MDQETCAKIDAVVKDLTRLLKEIDADELSASEDERDALERAVDELSQIET